MLVCGTGGHAQDSQQWENALKQTAHSAPEARVVVLHASTGKLVAAFHLREAALTLAAPGSTLKPLILYQALKAGDWKPDRRVPCSGSLTIAGHRLACSHPPSLPFDARQALAWSCNTYFSRVARALPPGRMIEMLRPTGLLGPSGLVRDEAVAEVREPNTPDETQLAVLGIDGIRVTPLELGSAYRWLAINMGAASADVAASTVQGGMMDSTSFGMAEGAGFNGASVAGKTGTAEGTASAQTHGWFVGLTPAARPRFIVVVYLPAGRGADAARFAGQLLARLPLEPR